MQICSTAYRTQSGFYTRVSLPGSGPQLHHLRAVWPGRGFLSFLEPSLLYLGLIHSNYQCSFSLFLFLIQWQLPRDTKSPTTLSIRYREEHEVFCCLKMSPQVKRLRITLEKNKNKNLTSKRMQWSKAAKVAHQKRKEQVHRWSSPKPSASLQNFVGIQIVMFPHSRKQFY